MNPWPYPLWLAHRGAGTLAPENTLAAFREGAALGWRGFECDVKLSADDQPFLLHDDTLERTTNGHGPAADLPWTALSRLDAGGWHGRRFAGEPPCSLQALQRYLCANALTVNLELKPSPGAQARTGAVVAAEAARLWEGQAVPPLLSSFQVVSLQAARATAPHLPRALLLERLSDGWLAQAQALGCVAVITHHPCMQPAVAEALHAAGLKAMVYTVNDQAQARRLIALGVAGVITDAVDRFAPAAA